MSHVSVSYGAVARVTSTRRTDSNRSKRDFQVSPELPFVGRSKAGRLLLASLQFYLKVIMSVRVSVSVFEPSGTAQR